LQTGTNNTITDIHIDSLLERKVSLITEGLERNYADRLYKIPRENAMAIIDFILSMKTEINLSANHIKNNIMALTLLSQFHNNKKSFKEMTREDILSYLDRTRKPERIDPLHKWIGSYNLYRAFIIRFFKWLYYPDLESAKRPKPQSIENIPQLKRKEQSIYKPTDLWTLEDDLLFLKYCPSRRDKCYHMISRDTGCRPHEILKLKIKDIVFKTATGNHQYAEVLVNGKTGSRHIPLINSLPYVKDWLDEHPQQGNPSAPLICGYNKSLARRLKPATITKLYESYKTGLFSKILLTEDAPPEDRQKIRELLKKPWNPYIRRHSALTEKSIILKEHVLRQYAGWSGRSQMHLKYLHYFGNESTDSILQAYGIVTKDQKLVDVLKSKQCPNCNEPNKPDAKFCSKCRMVLTYDAYNETVDEKQEKDDALSTLSDQVMKLMAEVQELKKQKK
jgi:integrase/recombinase XerD